MRNTYAAVTRRLNDPAFARQVIRYAFASLLGTVYLCCALTTGLLYELTHRPRPQHIYHDSMGKPRELIVTDMPYFTDSQVMNWVTDKVTNLYTLNYLDYGKHLDGCMEDFTPDAWNSWGSAFQGRGNLDFIKSKMVLLTAALKSAADVDAKGTNRRGDYEWHVSFPMYLKWTNAGGSKTDVLAVKVIVRRTNDALHPAGLVIAELNAHRIGGGEN